MVLSVLLCCLKNSKTQIKSCFQSFPPPLSVTHFRLNGQCWVWGKVSEDGGRMKIGPFFCWCWKCHQFLVFSWLWCASQAWCSLTTAALIRPTQFFVTLCPGRSRIPSFGLINSSFWWHLSVPQVHDSFWVSLMSDSSSLKSTICPVTVQMLSCVAMLSYKTFAEHF